VHDQVAVLVSHLRSDDESDRRMAAEDLGTMQDARAVPALVDALEDPSAAVREAAIDALSTIGGAAVIRAVLPALRSEEVYVRNAACVVLRNIGEPAVTHLTQLVRDDDQDVRKFAVDTLGLIGSPAAGEALIRALDDVNVNVAAAAAEALGQIRYRPAIPKMVSVMQANSWLRCTVARSLGQIGGAEAGRALVELIGDSDVMVVYAALRSLGEVGDESSLQYVLHMLEHENAAVVEAALGALEQILSRVNPQVGVALRRQIPLKPLLALLRNPEPQVRRSALALLAKIGHPDSLAALAHALAAPENRDHAELRHLATQAILSIKPRDVAPILEVLHESAISPEAACELIDVLGRLGQPAAFDVVASYSAHEQPIVRRVVARSLASIDSERAPLLLARALSDSDGHTRAHAARGLGTLLAGVAEAVISARPTDAQPEIRAANAWLAATFGPRQRADAVLLLSPLLKDEYPDVREAAARALGTIGNEAAFSVLQTLLNDADEGARMLAVAGLAAARANARVEALLRIALADSAAAVCAAAIRAFMSHGIELNAGEIRKALQHADSRVRGAMVALLSDRKLDTWAPEVTELFRNDPNPRVRYTCARALGRFGSVGAAEVLIECLSHASNDPLVVLGAVEALEALADERARDVLTELTGCADPEISAAACAALAALDASTAQGARPAASE